MTGRIASYRHDGLVFDVRDEGPLDGVPAVLLHGFPERSTSWRVVAPLLHAQGVRTLAPDQRGYSPGARPPRRRDYTVDKLVADVAALVDEVGGPVHVVGHDWGAAVAWGLAATRPDLVRTLTAVSVPHPAAFARAMVTSRQGLRSWYMLFHQLPWVPELAARPKGGPTDISLLRAGMRPDEVARYRREIVADGALPGALGWYRALPLSLPGSTSGKVGVPTTFVWSDGDVAIDRKAAEGCAAWVTGPYRLVVLPGVSHWIPTQAPERLAEVVLERIAGEEQP
jgi:pimeloyl-ACP methyl ester carboxylesterase